VTGRPQGCIDPQLPGLDAALDPAASGEILGLDPIGWRAGRRPHHVDYSPGQRATITWAVDNPSAAFGVIEVEGDGWRCRDWRDDEALPGLCQAVDPDAMASRLDALDMGQGCRVTPVRYRSGQRCVLRYDTTWDRRPATYFAKIVATGVRQLAETLETWHRAAQVSAQAETKDEANTVLPDTPAPVAGFEDLGMVLQAATPGRPVRSLLYSIDTAVDSAGTEYRDVLAKAGASLAAIHAYAPRSAGVSTSLASLLESPRGALGIAYRHDRQLATRLEHALDRLAASSEPEAVQVPNHGSFRADHLLFEGSRRFVVDLDGTDVAAPERDAANLVGYLRWKALREPKFQPITDAAAPALAAGYASSRPALDPTRLSLYEAATLLRIAGGRFRNLALDEYPAVPRLIEAAEAALERAEAAAAL